MLQAERGGIANHPFIVASCQQQSIAATVDRLRIGVGIKLELGQPAGCGPTHTRGDIRLESVFQQVEPTGVVQAGQDFDHPGPGSVITGIQAHQQLGHDGASKTDQSRCRHACNSRIVEAQHLDQRVGCISVLEISDGAGRFDQFGCAAGTLQLFDCCREFSGCHQISASMASSISVSSLCSASPRRATSFRLGSTAAAPIAGPAAVQPVAPRSSSAPRRTRASGC